MARYVLLSVALLAFCAVALAQRWPSGVPGGEELSAIAAAKDSSATVLGKDHKKVYKKPKYVYMQQVVAWVGSFAAVEGQRQTPPTTNNPFVSAAQQLVCTEAAATHLL
jgi:hypothetical protein